MDDKVVVDCIGPSVLTITISGATHSVPIATDVIRISGPGGGIDHNLESLPLIYDAAALGGRLNICDGAGKLLYCWRSSVMLQSRPSASAQETTDRSSSSSLGPAARTGMTTPDSSLASASPNRSKKRRSTSVRTGDTSRMSTASSTTTLTPSGDFNHDITVSRDNTSDNTLEEPAKEAEGLVNEELIVRFGRYLQELKRKGKWAELRERTLCQDCRDDSEDSVVANCLHVFCKACLMHSQSLAAEHDLDEVPCPVCQESMTETQSCKSLKELRLDNSCEAGLQGGRKASRETGKGYIDLEGEGADQPASGFTVAQKEFLVRSINNLMKLSYSEFFRQPVHYPNAIMKSMDLRTMRGKLHDGLYPSIEALRADFDRMEDSSVLGNGSCHKHTNDAQNLKVAFERYMIEYPGLGEDLAPRRKAKTTGSKTPRAKIPGRAGASSPPRAAKSAMQGQKYPRDHW